MDAKVSITARISPGLVEKIESSGLTKTEAIEKALSFFFDNCKDIKGYSQKETDIKEAVKNAFLYPDVSEVIRAFIGDAVREASRAECSEIIECLQGTVKQICKTSMPENIQECNTVDEPEGVEATDPAGPNPAEIEEALNRDLSDLINPEDLKALEPGEREEVREALALVSWCLEVQKKHGGSIKKACKLAGKSETTFSRKRRFLKSKGINF